MIWFWIIAGVLVLAALIALLRPLVRGAGESSDEGESVVAVFRRELANIDTELAQGRLAPDQAEEARAEVTRRMLVAADKESQDASLDTRRGPEASWRIGTVVGIAALLPAAALAIYAAVGSPAAINPARTVAASAAKAAPRDAAELAAAADQLKARLQGEPGHMEGWVLLGRTFVSLGRFGEAREAYGRAIALAPNEPRLHAELGEMLVLSAAGSVSPEAEAEFAKSGNDPRARFYGAEAALQRGDATGARTALRALLADAPADAPWRQAVAERLAAIEPDEQQAGANTPPASMRPSGPTAQDVAAAQAMSPEERQAMIRGMVERLATRLDQNPNDKEGWTRLARAYDVLGETDKAQAARARAAAAFSAPAAQAAPPAK
jgi:cytochrome c-type biogenesis protein CcmH